MDFDQDFVYPENFELLGSAEVEKVVAWLPKAPSTFDATFVRSLRDRLDRNLDLTEKQLSAIRNIISKFNIDGEQKRGPRKAPPRTTSPYYKTTDATAHYY